MRNTVGSLAVAAAMVMGGLAGSPAVAMDSPAAVAEKKPAPAKKGRLAKKLQGPGWTELVSGPMYTKSGKFISYFVAGYIVFAQLGFFTNFHQQMNNAIDLTVALFHYILQPKHTFNKSFHFFFQQL